MQVEHLVNVDRAYYVYALLCRDRAGGGYVKFGMTGNISRRLSELRHACPVEVRYYAVMKVGYSRDKALEIERLLHARFRERKIQGEWFRFDFKSAEDKADFNEGCKYIFLMNLPSDKQRWWTVMSVAEIDEKNKRIKDLVVNSGFYRVINEGKRKKAQQKRAWKELG